MIPFAAPLLSFVTGKASKTIYLAIAVGIIILIGLFYYTNTQARIESLVADKAQLEINNTTLKSAIFESQDAIDTLQSNYREVQDKYSKLEAQFQEIRRQNRTLQEKLGKHELDVLAKAKPGLVENIINNASNEANRCIELLSGAPLSEEEKNAKSAKDFNSECPFLYGLVKP